MIELQFFLRWNSNRTQTPDPFSGGITPEEAKALYDARQTYTAVVLNDGEPYAFVESHGDFVGVTFLDEQFRDSLRYGFRELQPGRLFMEQATYREYDGDSRRAAKQTIYQFKPEGTVLIKEDDFAAGTKRMTDPRSVDLSGNWDTYPEFGEYASLLRRERMPA